MKLNINSYTDACIDYPETSTSDFTNPPKLFPIPTRNTILTAISVELSVSATKNYSALNICTDLLRLSKVTTYT